MADETVDTLAEALVAARQEIQPVAKNGKNPHYGSAFVTLDDLLNEVVPKLNRHGIALVQMPTHIDSTPALKTELRGHGGLIHATMPLVLSKQDMQGLGSAITYARRYMLAAMLGIAEQTDDDANAAARPPDRRVDPETPVPRTYAEVEALWTANGLEVEWLEKAVKAYENLKGTKKGATQFLSIAVVKLLSQGPESPIDTFTVEQIQGVFAGLLDGVILEGPSEEELQARADAAHARVFGKVEGEDPSIEFGEKP